MVQNLLRLDSSENGGDHIYYQTPLIHPFLLPETPGLPDFPCTPNAVCANDTLGLGNVKFCRCLPRFRPVENTEGFPAFCHPDDTPEEVTGDYEYGAGMSLGLFRPIPVLLNIFISVFLL
jgi:hypothetical protein